MPSLYNDQIEKVLGKYKYFGGVIPRDKIENFLPFLKKYKKIGFIINLDKSSEPGSHWNSIFIDLKNDHSVEYYDSFGRGVPIDIKNDLKKLVDNVQKGLILKFKENKIKFQSDHTHNCGFFAINFLEGRFKGKSFQESSNAKEKDIRNMPIFGFI